MTTTQVRTHAQGFAHVEIIIIAVVVIGLGGAVAFGYINANNQKNATQRQAAEQQAVDSLKASALEKAAKLADENKKVEEAKKAEEAAKQAVPAPTPSVPAPSAPQSSAPSSAAYNRPLDNFEQLDPLVAYAVNPNGTPIYAGYFNNEVVKVLPYGTQLKVHRQDGDRAAVEISGEPAGADWAVNPKDVRRSL